MRTKRSIINTITGLIASFCSAILGIVGQALFLRILNVEYLGINGLFTNVIAMLSIADLGIGSAIIVNLYKPIFENDKDKIKSLMQFYKKAYNIIATIVLVIGLLLIPFLPFVVGQVSVDVNLTIVYLLFLFSTVSSYLLSFKRSIFSAEQKSYILNISQIIYLVVYNTLQIIVLYLTKNYYLYLAVKIICQLLENLAISIYANRKYKYLKDKNYQKLDKDTEKNIFSKVKALFFHKVASFVVAGTDNIIISSFLGIPIVGLYSNYNTIIYSVKNAFSKIISSSSASVGNLLVENDTEKTYLVFKKIKFLNFWIATFSATCLLVIMQDFIVLWIGKKYLLSNCVLIILVINYFLLLMRSSYSIFKDAAGIWQEDKFVPIIESLLNIIVSIILAKTIGLAGVFLGTIISGFVLWCYSYPKFVHKKIFNKSYNCYIKDNIKYLIIFILVASLSYFTSSLFIFKNNLIQVIIDTLVAIILSNFLLFMMFHRTEEFKYYAKLIKKIFKRRRKNNEKINFDKSNETQINISSKRKEDYDKKLKSCLLEILEYFSNICEKNNLTYYLGAGTLLGAIRHDGFIPWDDDVDVYMPREDYEKFIKLDIDNEEYWLDNFKTNSKNWLLFSKIRALNTEYCEKCIKNYDVQQGIWLDIFPLDNSRNNIFSMLKLRKIIIKKCTAALFAKNTKKINHYDSILKKVRYLFMKLVPNKLLISIREIMLKCENYNSNKYFVNFGSRYSADRQCHLKEKIFPLKKHIFVNKEYYVPNDTDYVLRKIYGEDYMELPPENKRVIHYPIKVKFKDGEEFYFDENK